MNSNLDREVVFSWRERLALHAILTELGKKLGTNDAVDAIVMTPHCAETLGVKIKSDDGLYRMIRNDPEIHDFLQKIYDAQVKILKVDLYYDGPCSGLCQWGDKVCYFHWRESYGHREYGRVYTVFDVDHVPDFKRDEELDRYTILGRFIDDQMEYDSKCIDWQDCPCDLGDRYVGARGSAPGAGEQSGAKDPTAGEGVERSEDSDAEGAAGGSG